SKIHKASELKTVCERLLAAYRQPVLVETYLPGREFTVGITGSGDGAVALGTLEIVLRGGAEAGAYSYANKERCEGVVEYRLVDARADEQVRTAEKLAMLAWKVLGCRDAGRIDLRCDGDGQPNFMEVNPLAGLHPEHSDLPILASKIGMTYVELIRRIVDS